MIRTIFEGLMLGLSSGIYCASSCLVFFMPYLVVEGKQKISENLKKVASFMIGRLVAYIAFAFVISFIGSSYHNIVTARFSNICLIAASSMMLAYSLTHNFGNSGFCSGLSKSFSLMRVPFFFGFFTGLNPCPPFLVGAARLWTLKSIPMGVVLFGPFGICLLS
jgi:sulfite exporter TauE/SafE